MAVDATDNANSETAPASRDLGRLARGSLWGVGGRLAGRTAALVARALVARRLGPARYGLFAIGTLVARIGGFITTLSLDRGVVRFGSPEWSLDPRLACGTSRRAVLTTAAAGVAAMALVFWLAGPIARAIFGKPSVAEVLRLFAPALLVAPLLRVVAAATTIRHSVRAAILAEEFTQPMVFFAGAIVILLLDPRIDLLAILYVASYLAGLLVAVHGWRRLFRSVGHLRSGSELMQFSLVTHLGSLLAIATTWGDRLMVSALLPSDQVGIYDGAGQFAFAFDVVASGFAVVMSPLVASLHASGDRAGLQDILRAGARWGLYLTIPPFLVACVDPAAVIRLILGASYVQQGSAALAILCLAHMLPVAAGGVGSWLVMMDGQWAWSRYSAIALVVQLSSGWLLIPRHGPVGAAASALAALAVLTVLALVAVWRRSRLLPFDRGSLRVLLAAGAALAAALAVERVLPPRAGVRVAALLGAASVAFYGAVIALGIDGRDRALARQLLRR